MTPAMDRAMGCAEARRLLLDHQRGRLAPEHAEALEAHLAECPACAHEDAAERALGEQLERVLPQYAAPLALKRALASRWPAPAAAPPAHTWSRRRLLASGAIAAALVLVVGGAWLAQRRAATAELAERAVTDAVNGHVRVLSRLASLEVRGGDLHRVRPWFAGQLDFSPAVPFAGDADYPLLGGTLEHVLDRRAAAFVYGRRLHTATLLVYRADDLPPPARAGALRAEQRRGFTVLAWRAGDLGYALVSELNPGELGTLARRLGAPAP
jgi:anti-sigma factor RsiW